MDDSRFDTLTRSFTGIRSRRGALGALLGGTLGSLGVMATEGKKKKKKKKKKGATVPPAGSGTVSPPPPCVPNCPAGTVCGSDGCNGSCGSCAEPKHCSSGKCCDPNTEKACATDPRDGAEVCDCCGQGTHLACEFDPAMQLTDCRCCGNGSHLCGGECCWPYAGNPTCYMCVWNGFETECGCMN